MKFVKGGPDIPDALSSAREEGKLVIFCGSGVSAECGLPTFATLTEQLYKRLLTPLGDAAIEMLDRQEYEKLLYALERDKGRDLFRKHLAQAVETETSRLDTHRALIELARAPDGALRLVTTNFDRLFESAQASLPVAIAPRLPVAKVGKWSALVYLHGRVDDEQHPPGRGIVVTSADFGAAYLTERWASHFVCELFDNFTVLLVGYSLRDPVMRYLVDALAADREVGDARPNAYALIPSKAPTDLRESASWTQSGITPLAYNASVDHAPLHETLKQWARIATGGFASRRNLIATLAPSRPASLTNEQESQLLCTAR